VGKPAREPHWLNRTVIESIHNDQIREHGERTGVRDENVLESALARPRNKWAYGQERDPAKLAAAYGFAFVKSHPYVDGNKRVGFLAMVTFLGINGFDFTATDIEVVSAITALAAGRLTEKQLSGWIAKHIRAI